MWYFIRFSKQSVITDNLVLLNYLLYCDIHWYRTIGYLNLFHCNCLSRSCHPQQGPQWKQGLALFCVILGVRKHVMVFFLNLSNLFILFISICNCVYMYIWFLSYEPLCVTYAEINYYYYEPKDFSTQFTTGSSDIPHMQLMFPLTTIYKTEHNHCAFLVCLETPEAIILSR